MDITRIKEWYFDKSKWKTCINKAELINYFLEIRKESFIALNPRVLAYLPSEYLNVNSI